MRSPALAVVGAAALLVLGAAGGGVAAGLVTGADIKDGTVASVDVKDRTLKAKDLAPATVEGLAPRLVVSHRGDGLYLPEDGSPQLVHDMEVPEGRWLVTVSATAFPHNGVEDPLAECYLAAPNNGNRVTITTVAGNSYANLGTQMVVLAGSPLEVTFTCNGVNAGVNQITLTALEVGKVQDVTPEM